jgi:hypothetical protein
MLERLVGRRGVGGESVFVAVVLEVSAGSAEEYMDRDKAMTHIKSIIFLDIVANQKRGPSAVCVLVVGKNKMDGEVKVGHQSVHPSSNPSAGATTAIAMA